MKTVEKKIKQPKVTRVYFSPPIDGCNFVFLFDGLSIFEYLDKESKKKYA